MTSAAAARQRGFVFVFVATVLWSLAGLFARMVPHLDIGTVLFGRAAFGGGCGLLLVYNDWRHKRLELRRMIAPMAPVVILMSSTAISGYVAAVMMTDIADVLVIYATLPFLSAAIAYVWTGERSSKRTMIAASAAMIGIVIMVIGGLAHGRLLGQAIAFFMTAALALLIVLQRRDPDLPVAPINSIAALVAAGFGYAIAKPAPVSWFDVGVLFVFGVTTIPLAFTMFMEGAKHVPPAEVSLIAMLDVVLGPFWVLIAFGERPETTTIIGGSFVLTAALWRLAPELRRQRRPVALS